MIVAVSVAVLAAGVGGYLAYDKHRRAKAQAAAAGDGAGSRPSGKGVVVAGKRAHPPHVLFRNIEALAYDQRKNGKDFQDHVGFLSADTWLRYERVDLGAGATFFTAYVAVADEFAGNTIEVRVGRPDGPIIAALPVAGTGGWGDYACQVAPVTPTGGVRDLYVRFSGGNSVGNLRWLKFSRTPRDATATIAAKSYDAMSGAHDHADKIGYLDEGDWVRFGGLDFGSAGVNGFTAEISVPDDHAGRTIEIHLDAPTGPQIGSLTVATTGAWDSPSYQTTPVSFATGVHDVYLTFHGGNGAGDLYSVKFTR